MRVSEADRRHFERVRAAKAEEARERMLEAIATSPIQRIIEGLELGELAPRSDATESALDRRALEQAELQRRARRLGLR